MQHTNPYAILPIALEVLQQQRASLQQDLETLGEQIATSVGQLRTLAELRPNAAQDYLEMAKNLAESFERVQGGLQETIARLDRQIELKRLN